MSGLFYLRKKSYSGCNIYLKVVGVEVAYVYNISQGEAIAINGLGNPSIRVAGSVTQWTWSGSFLNITWNSTSARISYTGSAYVAVSSSVGFGLESHGFSLSYQQGSTYYYWSPVVTQVMNFGLNSL